MNITSKLFEAYLKCPTKCWLITQGDSGLGNIYADWFHAQNESYRNEGIRRILDNFTNNKYTTVSPEPLNFMSTEWELAKDLFVQAQSMESNIHAVERIPCGGVSKLDQFMPIRFVFTNKINQDDKLCLAFDALILSESLGHEVSCGKIIHGENHITTKINTANLMTKVRKQLRDVTALVSAISPPDLVLKRYCAECVFQVNCRRMAFEKDDLSLLASMTKNERNQHRNKGIFTVNQLSYTFRPRKAPKRAKNPKINHYLALQALAIREKTVFIHGSPNYPESKTQVYLDIEGIPDCDSYYL